MLRRFRVDVSLAVTAVQSGKRLPFTQRRLLSFAADAQKSHATAASAATHTPLHQQLPVPIDPAAPASYIHPAAPAAYNQRVKSGCFSHPLELFVAPYAPNAIQIAVDVIELAIKREQENKDEEQQHRLLTVKSLGALLAKATAYAQDAALRIPDGSQNRTSLHALQFHEYNSAKAAAKALCQTLVKAHSASGPNGSEFIPLKTSEHDDTRTPSSLVDEDSDAIELSNDAARMCFDASLEVCAGFGLWDQCTLCLEALMKVDAPPPTSREVQANAPRHTTSLEQYAWQRRFELCIASCAKDATSEDGVNRKKIVGVVEERNDDGSLATTTATSSSAFDVAKLFLNFAVNCGVTLSPKMLTCVARTISDAEQLREFRQFFVAELTNHIPVSVPLYTAIIGACARAEDERGQLDFAMSLYRTIRDHELKLRPDTYAAIIRVCASCGATTQAFAMYREALGNDDGDESSSSSSSSGAKGEIAAALVEAYAAGGYAHDALETLFTLAPIRPMPVSAFHSALGVCNDFAKAHKIVSLMSCAPQHWLPTPSTYGYLVELEIRAPNGLDSIETVLTLHGKATAAARMELVAKREQHHDVRGSKIDEEQVTESEVDAFICERYSDYALAICGFLMSSACVPHSRELLLSKATNKQRLYPIARLQRLAQCFVSGVCGIPPQQPQRTQQQCSGNGVKELDVPIVACLAPDVMLDITEISIDACSLLLIPASSVIHALRCCSNNDDGAGGRSRDDSVAATSPTALTSDIRSFVRRVRPFLHLGSVRDELTSVNELLHRRLFLPDSPDALQPSRALGFAVAQNKDCDIEKKGKNTARAAIRRYKSISVISSRWVTLTQRHKTALRESNVKLVPPMVALGGDGGDHRPF